MYSIFGFDKFVFSSQNLFILVFCPIFSFNQKMTLAHQQLNTDFEKLKQEEADKSSKLQDLMYVSYFTI